MFHTVSCAIVLGLSLIVPSIAHSEMSEQYSKKELKELMKSAQTPDEYQKLSNHFRAKAAQYIQEANEQEAIMQRELVRPTRLKFPSAHDIAGRLRDRYRYSAEKATEKANHYERLTQSQSKSATP